MIDPRALRTFHEVCRAGSITGAARALNISQPSVSSAIALLEARLGAVLFERTRAGIVLTAAGHALQARAQMLEHLLRDAQAEVKAASEGLSGPLRIGGTPGALVSLLPLAMARFEDSLSQITLSVLERADRELTTMLREGDIEVAFVTTAMEEPDEDIAERTLARDPFALIVGPEAGDWPSPFSLKQADRLRWVLPEAQGAFRRQVDALFAAAGVPVPRDAIRCDSLLTTKALVRDCRRVTILPMRVAASELSMGVLRALPIAEAAFERSVGVRWLKQRGMSPLAGALIRELEGETIA
ncbi:DNA-binding transcriptional LysR family regulator [Novosphingobium sp. SG751A]|uniref:LysR family transcriptional regulator n=1 Tax=Novosphingobium sp. SG751A TaxID=2587000 RepID=UPI001557F721|nr:LysR family transcriptional regulator [Novosphingobium sp. SG751A]NOW48578.1 DNA-binding transcriptional LysR family regulator [Novosphingobium sp. SG751A]